MEQTTIPENSIVEFKGITYRLLHDTTAAPTITSGMLPNEIRAAMLVANIQNLDIAKTLGISPELVSQTIHRNPGRKGYRIREAIAKALGQTYEKIWGEQPPVNRHTTAN